MRRYAILMLIVAVSGCSSRFPAVVNPDAIGLAEDEMLIVRSTGGVAVIDFTDFGDQSSVSTYRWRFSASPDAQELTGQGEVFEKFKEVITDDGARELDRLRSQLYVIAGPFKIEWSYSSAGSGWLYLNKTQIKTTTLPDADFETYKLR